MSTSQTKPTTGKPDGKRNIWKKVLDYALPTTISALVLVWLFHKVHPRQILQILRDSCDYRWLLLMCAVEIVSRCVRGIRWGMQLRAAGIRRMPPMAEISSIFGAFTLNLMLTGVGEAWRCVYVARRQRASLSTVIGTDLGDRISDAMMITVIISVAFVVVRPVINKFMDTYSFGRDIVTLLSSPWFWIVIIGLLGALVWLLCTHSNKPFIVKIRTQARDLWNGFKVLFTMKGQLRFWSYTIVIWVAYFLMTYLCFFAFPFTRVLIRPDLAYGLLPGLVVFVFSAMSIAIPATGGLGPWNLAIMFALSLYGVSNSDAIAYTMVVWAFQTVTQVLMGLTAAGYITYDRHHLEKISGVGNTQ